MKLPNSTWLTPRTMFMAAALFLCSNAALLAWGIGESTVLLWLWLVGPITALACLPIALRATRGRPRAGWGMIGAGIATWLLADACYPLAEAITGSAPSVPGPPDVLYFVGYGLLTMGLVCALELATPARNARWLLDAVIMFVAGVTLLHFFVILPLLGTSEGAVATVVAIGYPLWDLALLAVLIVAAYTSRATLGKPAVLLGLAGTLLITTDAVYASWVAQRSMAYPPVLDLGWVAAYFAFAGAFLAAGEGSRHSVSRELTQRLGRVGILMPYAAFLPAISVAIYHGIRSGMDSGVVVAGSMLVGLVLLRQLAALSENQRLVRELSSENALRQRLMEAQSQLGQGIAVIENGRVRSANGAVQTITGQSEASLQSRPNLAWLVPLSTWRRHGVPRDDSGHMETAILQPGGALVEVEISWAQFGSAPNRTLLVLRDLSDRREAEAAMLRSEKARSLGMLAGGVAHDMNNMLTAVTGNAGLAALVAGEDSPAAPFLEDIQTAAARASELANSLLAYAGRDKATRQPTDLNMLVAETARLARSRISSAITLDVMLEPALLAVMGNDSALRQVAMNLIVNAADAIGDEPGQILVVTSREPDGRARLEVRDTGPGFDAETRSRLFDPFFTTKPTGKGLGLPTVIGVVRGHGGEVLVESEPGAGAAFSVLLPTTTEEPANASLHQPLGAWRTCGLAIVADDDPAVRSVTVRVLESCGMNVLSAKNGDEAIELALSHPEARCLVLDVDMPKRTGPQAWEIIRVSRPLLPVLFVSGYDARADAMKMLVEGQVAFLPKPYRVDDLLHILRGMLEPQVMPLAS